jgi:uncharacterized protein YjbI with pentapeptide repeats
MANPEHLEILKQGVERWNRWREKHRGARADLSGGRLGGADLGGVDFVDANLSGAYFENANLEEAYLCRADFAGVSLSRAYLKSADFTEAKLEGADLSRANLEGAELGGACLRGANLEEASLSAAILCDANLSGAELGGANLSGANLRGADLSGAQIWFTNFARVDLSTAKALETVTHYGPSAVDIDTIYESHGKIPEAFLRGCGVPDGFIAYIGSMVGRPIEIYSCFISCSTHDQEFAERIHADLQAKGVRCWFAPDDMKGGRKIHEQIDEAIRLHDRLLVILSEHSMSSEWVKTEIAGARKREVKEGKRVLFPVRLVGFERLRDWECFDGDTGKDSAREIREYFIPDFSNWKDHDSYQTAFQRLVSDLKAEESE